MEQEPIFNLERTELLKKDEDGTISTSVYRKH